MAAAAATAASVEQWPRVTSSRRRLNGPVPPRPGPAPPTPPQPAAAAPSAPRSPRRAMPSRFSISAILSMMWRTGWVKDEVINKQLDVELVFDVLLNDPELSPAPLPSLFILPLIGAYAPLAAVSSELTPTCGEHNAHVPQGPPSPDRVV
ncbi:Protein of unknown function [Gryllus bimaculatus]|nr:Protein of unknown function [Gryllus bimaculatus]